ncbi:hypothetical protein [Microvirga pakistanensis]|uniref:hypothetical protein n=1 Tax=Microvirga pakistanensis TaxID=1682650 RepID=UPI00106A2E1A|nr:hypothetical protein [Microvirga pakistanensis]
MHRAYTYGMRGDRENAARAVAKLNELVPGFTMAHAIEFHRKYQFEPALLDKIVEGLRRAGVSEPVVSPIRRSELTSDALQHRRTEILKSAE